MKKSTAMALNPLVGFATQATLADDLEQYIADNYQGIVEPLQIVGDFDLEDSLDIAMYTLWLTATTEADELTIKNVTEFYMNTISDTWQNYGCSVETCLDAKYGEVEQLNAVDFLNGCLQLEADM